MRSRHAWRPGRSQRVDAYAAMKGTDAGGPMAVLIQRLVDADAAGVAFANPITGDRDQVVVSAVRGMGERLVGVARLRTSGACMATMSNAWRA